MKLKHLFLALFLSVLTFQLNAQLIISQYVETNIGTTPKGLELWNTSGSEIDFSTKNLDIQQGTNGGTPASVFTLNTGTLAAGEVIVIGTSDMSPDHEKTFAFNGNDALVIKLDGTTVDVFGTPGSDPGSEWKGNGVSTKNQSIQLKSGITTGDTDGWTDPSERFETVSTTPSEDIAGDGLVGFGTAPGASPSVKDEPTNQPTALTVDAVSSDNITLTWTDALEGTQAPDKYLIKASTIGYGDISAPVDATAQTDATLIKNVAHGTQTVTFNSLEGDKTYYFKIWSYTNSGIHIDYKTDGTIQETAGKTLAAPDIIESQNFETDFDNWTTKSIDEEGSATWEIDTEHGVDNSNCAKINGYQEGANEDWLISPALNFNNYTGEKLSFKTAINHNKTGDNFNVYYSTAYDGTSDPVVGNWTEITDITLGTSWTYVESGEVDLSAISGENVYIAFRYVCTDAEAETWEVDDILITGYANIEPAADTATPFAWVINATEKNQQITKDDKFTLKFNTKLLNSSNETTNALKTAIATALSVAQGDLTVETDDDITFSCIFNGSATPDLEKGKTVTLAINAVENLQGTKNSAPIEFVIADTDDVPPTLAEIKPFEWTVNDTPEDNQMAQNDAFKVSFSEKITEDSYDILIQSIANGLDINKTALNSVPTDEMIFTFTYTAATPIDLTGGKTIKLAKTTITDFHENTNNQDLEFVIFDGFTPTVSNAVQTVTNAAGQKVNVQSDKTTGKVYIILDSEAQNTVNELNQAVDANKGAWATVTGADTDIEISTTNLMPGTYYAYAVKDVDMSVKGTNAITITDGIAPNITTAQQTATNAAGQKVNLQSNETGLVGIILDGESQANFVEMQAAVDANKGAWATVITPDTDVAVSTYNLIAGTYYAYAVDAAGNISTKGTNAITINEPLTTIYEIQYTTEPSGDSPLKDQVITTKGIVTAVVSGKGYFIQEAAEAWKGIYVYDNTNTPTIGDEILLKAKVVEYYNLTELKETVKDGGVENYQVLSSGNTLPEPIIIDTDDMNEEYEGVLVKIENAICTRDDYENNHGMWGISSSDVLATNTLFTDDNMYAYETPLKGNKYTVTGIGDYSFDEYKILPRSEDDIVVTQELPNNPPIIGDIILDPETPQVNTPTTVIAQITDAEGTIKSTKLFFGLTKDDISSELTFQKVGFSDNYSGTIPGAAEGLKIYFKIEATDNKDEIATKIDSFTVGTVSVPKYLNQQISIYPNPANDIVKIKTENNMINNVIISDMFGRKIKTYNRDFINEMQINVKQYAAGIYFLHINTEQNTVIYKLIIK